MTTPRRVVITGVGIGSPAGTTMADNVAAWREGKRHLREITRFNVAGGAVRYAGECADPNPKLLPDRKVQKILRRKDVISLLATIDAAKDAGLTPGSFDPERCGMYVGASATQIGDLTPYFTIVGQCVDLAKGTFDSARFGRDLTSLVNPLVVLQNLMNNGLCFGTMTLDIRGINTNFMDFQVASLRAIGEAFRGIADGRAEIAFAGGVSGPVEPFQLADGVQSGYLADTRVLSRPIDELVRPWDEQRSGTVLSEGSAYLVLEEEQHAIRRGATIRARVVGYALANDGMFDWHGEKAAPGLSRAISLAVKEAGEGDKGLGFLIGHGSGAVGADRAEAAAYQEYLGDRAKRVPLMSPKAVLGDLCEAGGALAALVAIDTLAQNSVPPTFNHRRADNGVALSIRETPQTPVGRIGVVTARSFLGLAGALALAPA